MAKTRGMSTPAPSVITPIGDITGGVDTHKDFHVAAAVDSIGRTLGTEKFPATAAGYGELLAWLRGFGPLALIGVEGTGSYGAGLSTHLTGQPHGSQVRVVEVNRPNRQKRRQRGKSDPQDAINAALAALAGEAAATPKPRTGPIESVRVLRTTRRQLIEARTALINTLHALIVTAPATLRESLHGLSTTALITHCAALTTPALPGSGLRGTARTQARDQLAQALLDSTTTVKSPWPGWPPPSPTTTPVSPNSTPAWTPWSAGSHPSPAPSSASAPAAPPNSCSPPATTPTASTAKQPSPTSSAPHHWTAAAAASNTTDSPAPATAKPTQSSTTSSSPDSPTTKPPAPTSKTASAPARR